LHLLFEVLLSNEFVSQVFLESEHTNVIGKFFSQYIGEIRFNIGRLEGNSFVGWAIMHVLHHARESNEQFSDHSSDQMNTEGLVFHVGFKHVINASASLSSRLEFDSLVGVGLHNTGQDDLLNLSNSHLLTESIASLTTSLLSLSFFLFTENTLTLCFSLSVDLVENSLLVTESLGLQAGGESLTNAGFLLLFGIDVEPGLGVQLGDEVGPEGKVLSGA